MNIAQLKAVGDIHEITPNLFLGNMWSTDPNVLNQHGIEVVLNVSREETDVNKGRYKLHSHLVLKIDDNASASQKMLSEIIPKSMRYLDQFLHESAPKQRRVLIHCVAGVSRSSTIVCAWLMKNYGMTRDKALTFMKSRRSVVHPNDGFMKVLQQWETHLKRSEAINASREHRTQTTGRGYNYPGFNRPPTNATVASGVVPLQSSQSLESFESHQPYQTHQPLEYNAPAPMKNPKSKDYNAHLHHIFKGDQLDNYENMQNRQFERRFSVIPSEADELIQPQQAPSYYREFEEKVHSNDDHFRHLY